MDRPGHSQIAVLHVDDEPGFAETAAEFLRREDEHLHIETVINPREGLERLAETEFDCVLSDYDMPEMNGIEFLKAVRATHPDLPFILFTGKGSEEIASEAISAGVSDYLRKGRGTERYALLANRVRNLVSQHWAENGLERRVQQQATVADLGQYALTGCALDDLFDRAAELVAESLDTEYSKVLQYRPAHDDLLLRAGTGWESELVGTATVGADSDSQAGYTLQTGEPVVVEDLRTETRFSGPSLLVDSGVVSGISVIIGSPEEPWGVLATHTKAQRGFTEDDITFVRSVANILTDAIEREQLERDRRQAEQRYRTLLENFPDGGVFMFDDDLRYLVARGERLNVLGLDPTDIEGKTIGEVFPEDVVEVQEPKYRAALNGEEQVWVQEYDGRQYRVHALPVSTDGKERLGMVISQDISELYPDE